MISFLGNSGTVLSNNLYSYCENNPISRIEYNGCFWISLIVAGVSYLYLGGNLVHSVYNQSKLHHGYIYNQNKGRASEYYFGFFKSSYNGCGWIATYNAAIMLGTHYNPNEIIAEYEFTGAILGGTFGIQPYAISWFFESKGYDVTITYDTKKFNEIAKKSTSNIIFYAHSKGAHYVALQWDGSKFVGYNTYSSSNGPDNLGSSLLKFLGKDRDSILLISIN